MFMSISYLVFEVFLAGRKNTCISDAGALEIHAAL